MAAITVNFPNDQADRVVSAMCGAGGYTGDPANNAARNEFARTMVINYVKNIVRVVEKSEAQTIALNAVNVVDADIT